MPRTELAALPAAATAPSLGLPWIRDRLIVVLVLEHSEENERAGTEEPHDDLAGGRACSGLDGACNSACAACAACAAYASAACSASASGRVGSLELVALEVELPGRSRLDGLAFI